MAPLNTGRQDTEGVVAVSAVGAIFSIGNGGVAGVVAIGAALAHQAQGFVDAAHLDAEIERSGDHGGFAAFDGIPGHLRNASLNFHAP